MSKINDKEHMALYKQCVSATGGSTGTPDLSPFDEHMASIVRETSVAGVVTDMGEDETTDKPGKHLRTS